MNPKNIQFLRFLLVGGLNTLFGYSVYAFFLFLNFHYTLATFLSTVLGVAFNFKTTGKLVFNNDKNSLFIKFIGVYTIIYLLNIGFLRIFAYFEVNMYLAGGLLILPMAVISFILNKKFVFNSDLEIAQKNGGKK